MGGAGWLALGSRCVCGMALVAQVPHHQQAVAVSGAVGSWWPLFRVIMMRLYHNVSTTSRGVPSVDGQLTPLRHSQRAPVIFNFLRREWGNRAAYPAPRQREEGPVGDGTA